MKFKGPVFPSYLNQRDTSLDKKMQWRAHCGKRAQLRSLRQICRPTLENKNQHIVAQVARIVEAVKDEPMPEFGKLNIIFGALDACEQTGEPLWVCLKYLMDKFDDMQEDARAAATAAPGDDQPSV